MSKIKLIIGVMIFSGGLVASCHALFATKSEMNIVKDSLEKRLDDVNKKLDLIIAHLVK